MTNHAYPHADSRLADFLRQRIQELAPRKTQREIAMEAGFRNANVLSMIKRGDLKLAIDRVPALANALEIDPARLLLLTLAQHLNESAYQTIRLIIGTVVTRNEVEWVEEIRAASGHTDPRLTSLNRPALRAMFER